MDTDCLETPHSLTESDMPGMHYPRSCRSVLALGVAEGLETTNLDQDSAIDKGWVVGFVDAEGCFSIHLQDRDRHEGACVHRRKGTGIGVSHAFAVVQGAKSAESLHELRRFFGVGDVYVNRRFDNHKEDMYRYNVTRREHLLGSVIPFFKQHPLLSPKRLDFEKFERCLRMMEAKRHLTSDGLIEIARIAETMNRCVPLRGLIESVQTRTQR
jgi:hypothetical protein